MKFIHSIKTEGESMMPLPQLKHGQDAEMNILTVTLRDVCVISHVQDTDGCIYNDFG